MSAEVLRASDCVDCGMTIVGERLRCPRCHEQHVEVLLDEDVTAPRVRENATHASIARSLVTWLVIIELVLMVVLIFALALGDCS